MVDHGTAPRQTVFSFIPVLSFHGLNHCALTRSYGIYLDYS